MTDMNALWDELQERISAFVRTSPENRLMHVDNTPFFDKPLLGVAHGDDPLFQDYKEIIGAFHLTPREVMAWALEQDPAARNRSLDELRVLCYALPITEETRASNRPREKGPSRRWAHTRNCGEGFNDAVRDFVVEAIREMGYLAVAPARTPLLKVHGEGIKNPPASTWSERHMLYAAGLGTFSLSDGFITPKGIAMRCGSVATNLALPVTPRPYQRHIDNCLFLSEGTCGECIKRCPGGAISAQGHDKGRCSAYMGQMLAALKEEYDVRIVGCGLCQTGVPCEGRIPEKRRATA